MARDLALTSPAAVGVALDVGVADPGHAQVLELVVLAHPGEGDAVVDLRDLVEQGRGVLGDEEDAVPVLDGDDGLAAGDALAGILRLVLHHLLGRDVVGQRHYSLCLGRLRMASQWRRISSSGASAKPERVMVFTDGQDPAQQVGPAGAEVLVGRVDQRLDGDPHRLVPGSCRA